MYLGIDLGTSSVKTVMMNEAQQIIASASAEQHVSRPHDRWSEQDPADWISGMETTLSELQKQHPNEMAAVRGIGLSGQQHGATFLDANDKVIRPCILWNDTRSFTEADALDTTRSRDLCGNIMFPGFTSPKVAWLANNEPENFQKVATVLLPKDYARLWLTGEHVSEMSDASGTGWLDVGKRAWSEELLAAVGLNTSQMPRLVEGSAVSGKLRAVLSSKFGMPESVVVAGGAGDNAASACGMGTVASGSAFLSLGTSGVLFAANDAYRPNAASAVHAFCHALPGSWHQMGVILAATDTLNWLSGITGQAPSALTKEWEGSEAEPGEVIFLPYLGGERTPHSNADARGVFVGLGHSTDRKELTRAVLQGVSFAFRDCKAALESAGTELQRASAIGGGSRSNYWLQMLASSLNIPLQTTVDGDFGAGFGAARLGMIAAEGADPFDICKPPAVDQTIEPNAALVDDFSAEYERYRQTYKNLVSIM